MATYNEKMFKALKAELEAKLDSPNAEFIKLLRGYFEFKDWSYEYISQFRLQERVNEFPEEIFTVYQYLSNREIGHETKEPSYYYIDFADYLSEIQSPEIQNAALEHLWIELNCKNKRVREIAKFTLHNFKIDRARTLVWLLREYGFETDEFYERVEEYIGLARPNEEKE